MGEIVGAAVERSIDKFEPGKYFRMKSIYIYCDVDLKNACEKMLDAYEKELDFSTVQISVKDALTNNEELLESSDVLPNPWLARETGALRQLVPNETPQT